MKNNFSKVCGWSILVIALLTGCKKNPAGPDESQILSQPNQEALSGLIDNDALFTNDAMMLNDGNASLAKITSAIDARGWGRRITSSSRDKQYTQIDDSTILVTITNTWSGTLWIREHRPSPLTDTIITKPFEESSVRKVEFVKVANTNHPLLNWRMKEVSGMQGGTTSSQNITIQKIVLFIGDDTLQITDPLNYFFEVGRRGRHGLEALTPSLVQGFRIQVTVKSTDPDSDLIVAHRPMVINNSWSYRSPMALMSSTPNSDSTFTRVYENSWRGAWTGRYNVMIGAIPRSAIYDDATFFSSQLWGIPFIVN